MHKLFKAFADSIINIFIPLFILKTTNNLILSLGYLCMYSALVAIFNLILKKFIQKYGVIAIILHFLPILAAEALLNFCPLNFTVILFVALFMSLSQVLYSVPFNLIFLYGDKHSNVAKFQIATNVGKLIFILISGYILSSDIQNSFLWLSIASSIFYIISVIPIGFGFNMLKEKFEISTGMPNKAKPKQNITFALYHVFYGIFQAVIDNCLPLFLYINGLSFSAVTSLLALVALCKILANYIAKLLTNKRKQVVCFVINFVIFLSSLICMMCIHNSVILYIFSCLCSVAFPFTFVPMFKLFCENVRGNNSALNDMVLRDVYIFSGRPVVYAFSMILSMFPGFVFGIFATAGMLATELKLGKPKPDPKELQANTIVKKQILTNKPQQNEEAS